MLFGKGKDSGSILWAEGSKIDARAGAQGMLGGSSTLLSILISPLIDLLPHTVPAW